MTAGVEREGTDRAERFKAIRERHVIWPAGSEARLRKDPDDLCRACRRVWPCDTAVALDYAAQVEAERDALRGGLRQIVEGDYPADAINAETWAAEVLADPAAVAWDKDVCGHDSLEGVDTAPGGPDKVWHCLSGCDGLYRFVPDTANPGCVRLVAVAPRPPSGSQPGERDVSAAADAVRSLILGGVIAIDHDEQHYADVRRKPGERPWVKYLGGDYESFDAAPSGTWVVVALDPDVAAEVLSEFDSSFKRLYGARPRMGSGAMGRMRTGPNTGPRGEAP